PAISGSRSAISFAALLMDAANTPSNEAAAMTMSLRVDHVLRGQRKAASARCASLTAPLFVVNFDGFQKTRDEIVAGNSGSKLHGLARIEMACDRREYCVRHLYGTCHGFGVLEHRTIGFLQ